MAFKLEIGQYFEADSPIHALDARVKFCCAFAAMIALFCAATPAQLAAGAAFSVGVVAASRVPVGRVAASVRPLVFFLAFLSLFNLIFVQTGNELLAAGPVRITDGGVWAAILYSVRFGLALMVGSLILLTTTPTELSDGFDAMLAPLARLGLPAHEIAMVFSLMLRFVPTLADEASASPRRTGHARRRLRRGRPRAARPRDRPRDRRASRRRVAARRRALRAHSTPVATRAGKGAPTCASSDFAPATSWPSRQRSPSSRRWPPSARREQGT